ncbi:MAG TPA: FixH family protein [Thermoanaerobaculia bacterium]|nr:FixH family protein [Thermoanaerobaculia bacterium]
MRRSPAAAVLATGLAAVLLGCTAGGCAQPAGSAADESAPVQVDTAFAPDPPAVGPVELAITVTDPSGRPVEDARVAVEGNMNHAGMVPVLGRAAGGDAGRYTVPLELTMGGDWYFLIAVTLPDGGTVEHRVDARVVPRP